MAGHGKRRRHDDHAEHVDERWLVTYADLMTLLVALFMVLFSISSVNKSKFETLQQSLQEAFSGHILPGGQAIRKAGGNDDTKVVSETAAPPTARPSIAPRDTRSTGARKADGAAARAAAVREEQDFEAIKRRLDAAAAKAGLAGKVSTRITEDGLSIRVLTDDLLFASGSATLRPAALPLLHKVATVLGTQPDHQLVVEGHTDDQPISGRGFPDNLALSTARAASIFRIFQSDGISPDRMTAAGRSSFDPVATNATAAGRALNRRVEILVPRTLGVSVAAARSSEAKVAIPSIRPDLSAGAASSSSSTTSSAKG